MQRVRIRVKEAHPIEMISRKQLGELLGLKSWTLSKWQREGYLPKPVKLSRKTLRWRVSDIAKWIEERNAA